MKVPYLTVKAGMDGALIRDPLPGEGKQRRGPTNQSCKLPDDVDQFLGISAGVEHFGKGHTAGDRDVSGAAGRKRRVSKNGPRHLMQ
eukprot:3778601-Karenia_brevis.AAC.1